MKPTLWVFWFGQFMEFFTPYLVDHFEIYIYDRNHKNTQKIELVWAGACSLEVVAQCDYVLLWYPASYTEELLKNIHTYLKKWAVVFDICSVKTPVVAVMKKYVPNHCDIISTHPIFGPQSWKDGIAWLQLTLSDVRSQEKNYTFLKSIFHNLELEIIEMWYDEHDREMAYVLSLSHFIAKSLDNIKIPKTRLHTTAYSHLLSVVSLLGKDSQALYLSIQNDNPYAKQVRQDILQEFTHQNNFIHSDL